jgi:bifunctional DNA-binding transcriptional regulator/antitoxin component of YhaV-PrlF toxin-antitoxin module
MTYLVHEEEYIKITKLYPDGKTQVPPEVIKLFNLKKGKSKILWVQEDGKIFIKPSKK